MRPLFLLMAWLLIADNAFATSPSAPIHPYLILPSLQGAAASNGKTITCEMQQPCSIPFGFGGDRTWGEKYTLGKSIPFTIEWKIYTYDLSDTNLANIRTLNHASITRTNAHPNAAIPISVEAPGEYIGTFTFTDPETQKTDVVNIAVIAEDNKIWINDTIPNIFYGITDLDQRVHMLQWRHKKSRELWVSKVDFKSRQEECGHTYHSLEEWTAHIKDMKKEQRECNASFNSFKEQIKNDPPGVQQVLSSYTGAKFDEVDTQMMQRGDSGFSRHVSILPYTPIIITAETNFPALLLMTNGGEFKNALGKSHMKSNGAELCAHAGKNTPCAAEADDDGKLRITDVVLGDQFTTDLRYSEMPDSTKWNAMSKHGQMILTIQELDEIPAP